MGPLTPKQQKFLKYIEGFIKEKSYAPTMQDMAQHFRLSSLGTVQQYLEALETKGYIQRSNKARGLQMIKSNRKLISKSGQNQMGMQNERGYSDFGQEDVGLGGGSVGLPLLGRVAAGRPIEYRKEGEKKIVPHWMLDKQGDHFLLQVQGDSMVDEGILDGDWVIVRRQPNAESGQIVVAMIEDEATIKKLVRHKDRIELHSANPRYTPISVLDGASFRIEGVYCGLLRQNI